MPAAAPIPVYNTGYSSGMNSGTTQTVGASSLSSGAAMAGGGNANISCGVLVGGALVLLLVFHLLGFRFGFDVSVGRGR